MREPRLWEGNDRDLDGPDYDDPDLIDDDPDYHDGPEDGEICDDYFDPY